jgi:hypothetical protein
VLPVQVSPHFLKWWYTCYGITNVKDWVLNRVLILLSGQVEELIRMYTRFTAARTLNLQILIPIKAYNSSTFSTRCRSWLRHYATSRKVTGSIPDEVIGFFNWPNPSSRIMALGSTQPPTEMSTRNIPEGKGRPARGTDNLTAICELTV